MSSVLGWQACSAHTHIHICTSLSTVYTECCIFNYLSLCFMCLFILLPGTTQKHLSSGILHLCISSTRLQQNFFKIQHLNLQFQIGYLLVYTIIPLCSQFTTIFTKIFPKYCKGSDYCPAFCTSSLRLRLSGISGGGGRGRRK